MKKSLLVSLLTLFSFVSFAQSQFFCIESQQTSSDSWIWHIYKDPSWNANGSIQIRETWYPNVGAPTSTGWVSFSNGMQMGGSGNGGYSVVEIRIVHIITGAIINQFEVNHFCE